MSKGGGSLAPASHVKKMKEVKLYVTEGRSQGLIWMVLLCIISTLFLGPFSIPFWMVLIIMLIFKAIRGTLKLFWWGLPGIGICLGIIAIAIVVNKTETAKTADPVVIAEAKRADDERWEETLRSLREGFERRQQAETAEAVERARRVERVAAERASALVAESKTAEQRTVTVKRAELVTLPKAEEQRKAEKERYDSMIRAQGPDPNFDIAPGETLEIDEEAIADLIYGN
jgi:hypothetical protein